MDGKITETYKASSWSSTKTDGWKKIILQDPTTKKTFFVYFNPKESPGILTALQFEPKDSKIVFGTDGQITNGFQVYVDKNGDEREFSKANPKSLSDVFTSLDKSGFFGQGEKLLIKSQKTQDINPDNSNEKIPVEVVPVISDATKDLLPEKKFIPVELEVDPDENL